MNSIFETQRLYISPIATHDEILSLYENIYKEPENLEYLNYDISFSLNNLKLKLLLHKKFYKVDLGIYLAKLKSNDEVIGEASFFNSFDNVLTPEIGYIINKPFWNKGYGSELVEGMLNYLFSKNIKKVYSRMNSKNINSYKICIKNGFKEIEETILENNVIRKTLILNK